MMEGAVLMIQADSFFLRDKKSKTPPETGRVFTGLDKRGVAGHYHSRINTQATRAYRPQAASRRCPAVAQITRRR